MGESESRDFSSSAKPAIASQRMTVGIVGGLAAAVLYTASNIALRGSVEINPFLVSAVKAAPTVLVLTPFLLWQRRQGQPLYTSLAMAPRFAAVALFGQFVGNAAFQFALGSIGLAASVPITLGTLLIASAVLGRMILGEPVNGRSIAAMIILMAAVVVLSIGKSSATPANEADQFSAPSSADSGFRIPTLPRWAGAACASASGAAYALFGTIMRQTMSRGMSPGLTMWISGIVGTVSLWTVTFPTMTGAAWDQLTLGDWHTMAWGGIFNLSAFIALSLALKALPVVLVNLINASQVAMAAVAGVLLFDESVTLSLLLGIVLTFAGLLVLAQRKKSIKTEP